MRRWMRAVCMAAGLWPAAAPANPFSSLPLQPMGEIAPGGRILVTLTDGDHVLPRFSPDARYLAFARVVLQDGTEFTEIRALDLATLKVTTLLDAGASRRFAVYKSYVAGFSWTGPVTLKASVSDGDVGGVDLVFDAAAGRLIEKKPLSLADDATDAEAAPTAEMTTAFPTLPPPVLANALANGFRVGDGKYVVQKNYWQQDNHVWLLDAGSRQITRLVDIPETWIYSLRGAFAAGRDIILLVAYGREAWLARHAAGRLQRLHRFAVKNYQQTALRVEHARGGRVLFQAVTGADYEKRENLLFLYDRGGLRRLREAAPIYDLDVDGAGRFLALSQWQGNRRVLVVREWQDPR